LIFHKLKIDGAWLIEIEKLKDERGYFARTWCQKEFAEKRINTAFVQCNISFNHQKGTLRGMHYQIKPHGEDKLVMCIKGAIYDVILDMRRNSSSFGQWQAVELSECNFNMIYIPKGLAHGFQTLVDNTQVFYHMSNFYQPQSARGFRWNDKTANIVWPLNEPVISSQDKSYDDLCL
jgi:dTDP-4-dehydrorhamnose 3,5-epimerase